MGWKRENLSKSEGFRDEMPNGSKTILAMEKA